MTAAILNPIALHPQGTLIEGSIFDDKKVEHNTFRCGHCGRIVIMDPVRAVTGDHRKCRQCGQPTCGKGPCDPQMGCNDFRRDIDRAYRASDGQPWLLRHWGEPVDTIYAQDGTPLLVLRKDHNMNLRERERGRRS